MSWITSTNGKRTGVLHRKGIIHDPLGLIVSPLNPVASHAVNGLRRQADVSHDRDIYRGHGPDNVGHGASPLDLDRLGAPLLDHPPAIPAGILDAGLV
jgi:hypothetical protein